MSLVRDKFEDGITAGISAEHTGAQLPRKEWQRPSLSILPVYEAETGPNNALPDGEFTTS